MTLNTYFVNRLKKLQNLLKEKSLEGCVIDHTVDLFYLTGLQLSLGRLIVTQKEASLFVDGRYFEMCLKKSPVPTKKNSIEAIKSYLKDLKSVGFDSAITSVENYEALQKLCPVKLTKLPCPLKLIRAIKDAQESLALKKSAALLWKGFLHIKKMLKEGLTERAVAKEFEIYMLKQGASKLAFEPIIAFGKNSAMPHYRAGTGRLKKGDSVLIDIGVVVDHYHSDMTRVIHFGKTNPKLIALEKVVRCAHKAALNLCRPGEKVKQLDLAAREEMRKAGVEDLFVHSLGHGVGLEIHEFPRVKQDGEDKDVVLEAGMVITIEPGLYLPNVGGIRHEDTILITPQGYDNFYD